MKSLKKAKTLKAFTLVELIVVMVILGLLMALVVPQVTKYIDKAGELAVKSEARAALTALQSYAVEEYGDTRAKGKTLQENIANDLKLSRTTSKIYVVANVPAGGKIDNVKVDAQGTKITSFDYYSGLKVDGTTLSDQAGAQKISYDSSKGFSQVSTHNGSGYPAVTWKT